jgi:ribosomal protein L7/L12
MSAQASIDDLSSRVAYLEKQVAFLMAHLQLKPPPDSEHGVSPEVLDLVQRGKKTQAIQRFRQETGAGLKAAKEIIESLEL